MTDDERIKIRDIIDKSPLLRQVEVLLFATDTERFMNAVKLLADQIIAAQERRCRLWHQSKITGDVGHGLWGPESFVIRAKNEAVGWTPDFDYWLEYENEASA